MELFKRLGRLSLYFASVQIMLAAAPWDVPFQGEIKQILEAAAHVAPQENSEIVVLLEDHHYSVKADGRIVMTVRKVYRIEQQDAVEEWSTVEHNYRPWYQQTPVLRARVIGKNGSEQWLDPKTVADAPTHEIDPSMFSDERVLRAPLPHVEPGSIVEYEIVVTDKAPLLDAGVADRIVIPNTVPLQRFHAIIDADPAVNLHVVSKLVPESALHQSKDGSGTRVECDLGALQPQKTFEWNLPGDVPQSPYIAFSTGKSWQAIASRYEEIVDQRLRNADLKKLMEGIDLNGSPKQILERLTARMHKTVRYTGVEFGEAAIVPGRPEDTIQRGYGDCKDKAALLVAMLRSAGLTAHVALLDAGYGSDPDGELPGLGVFDHAIVYVDAKPPIWVDATATDSRVGFLPPQDEGRLALIASKATEFLVRIPSSESKDNWEHQKIEIWMSSFGPSRQEGVLEVNGSSFESLARASYGKDANKSSEQLEKFVKKAFAAKSLGKSEVMARDDMHGPFRMTVEALEAKTANTALDDAAVVLTPRVLFEYLPFAVETDTEEKDEKPRQHDFVFVSPYQIELHYIIHPPPLFKAAKLPESAEKKIGTGSYSQHFAMKSDGSIEALYRFDSGKRRLTAGEFHQFRSALKDARAHNVELLTLVPETAEYVALGQSSKAITLLRQLSNAHPDDATLHIRLSGVLLSAGLGDAALDEARIAQRLDPKSSSAWMNLGMALQHDSFGRLRQGDWSPAEAETALRKSMELDPDNELAPINLAILLEYNPQGWRYGSGARMEEALAIYRELAKKPQHQPMIDQNLAILLMRNKRLAEAKQILDKLGDQKSALLSDTITAIEEGPARTIVKSQAAYPEPRDRAIHLASISQSLTQLRSYEAASAVMNAVARLITASEIQTRAEMLAKLKPWQDQLFPETDPRRPVQQLLLEAFGGTLTDQKLKDLASKRLHAELKPEEVHSLTSGVSDARQMLATTGLEEDGVLDLLSSFMELEKVGDDSYGYRIHALSPGTSQTFSMYVVPEDGKFKFIGGLPTAGEGIGELVLELLDKNDLAGARWWLDHVSTDSDAAPDGTGRPAIASVWSGVNDASRGPAEIRVAAAALIGSSTPSPKSLAVLEAARLKAPNAMQKSQIDKAICETLLAAKKWEDLMVAARRLEASKVFFIEGRRYFIKAATAAQKWKDLETEAVKMMDGNPAVQPVGKAGSRVVVRVVSSGDIMALKAMVLSKWKQGDNAGLADGLRRITSSELAGSEDHIFAAWVAMGQGTANEDTLRELRKRREGAGNDKLYALTLAMMEALIKQTDVASQELVKAAGSYDLSTMPAMGWAVHSKICEQYGFQACMNSAREKALRAMEGQRKDDELVPWLQAVLSK